MHLKQKQIYVCTSVCEARGNLTRFLSSLILPNNLRVTESAPAFDLSSTIIHTTHSLQIGMHPPLTRFPTWLISFQTSWLQLRRRRHEIPNWCMSGTVKSTSNMEGMTQVLLQTLSAVHYI
jgi:hypothetical protein